MVFPEEREVMIRLQQQCIITTVTLFFRMTSKATKTRKRFLKTKIDRANKLKKSKVLKFEGREKGITMLLKIFPQTEI